MLATYCNEIACDETSADCTGCGSGQVENGFAGASRDAPTAEVVTWKRRRSATSVYAARALVLARYPGTLFEPEETKGDPLSSAADGRRRERTATAFRRRDPSVTFVTCLGGLASFARREGEPGHYPRPPRDGARRVSDEQPVITAENVNATNSPTPEPQGSAIEIDTYQAAHRARTAGAAAGAQNDAGEAPRAGFRRVCVDGWV